MDRDIWCCSCRQRHHHHDRRCSDQQHSGWYDPLNTSRCLTVSVAQLIQVYVCAFPLHRGGLCASTHWCFGAGGGGGALLQVRSSHGAISNISLALSNMTASNNAAHGTSQSSEMLSILPRFWCNDGTHSSCAAPFSVSCTVRGVTCSKLF